MGNRSFFNVMPLTLEQKKEIVTDLRDKLKKQQGITLVDFSALSADALSDLRQQLRDQNCLLQAVKKNLLQRALEEEKIPVDIDFQASIGVVFGFEDLVVPAKTVYQFVKKDDRIKVLGGIWDNEFKDQAAVMALAQLPSYPEMMARFVWTLKSPASGLANVLQGTLRGLVIALSEVQKQKSN